MTTTITLTITAAAPDPMTAQAALRLALAALSQPPPAAPAQAQEPTPTPPTEQPDPNAAGRAAADPPPLNLMSAPDMTATAFRELAPRQQAEIAETFLRQLIANLAPDSLARPTAEQWNYHRPKWMPAAAQLPQLVNESWRAWTRRIYEQVSQATQPTTTSASAPANSPA